MDYSEGNKWSVASILCGIVSLFIIPRVFGLVAVILGIMGMANGEEKKSYSVTGIIIGVASFLYSFMV